MQQLAVGIEILQYLLPIYYILGGGKRHFQRSEQCVRASLTGAQSGYETVERQIVNCLLRACHRLRLYIYILI